MSAARRAFAAALLLGSFLPASPAGVALAGDPAAAPQVDADAARRAAAELWKAADDARKQECFGEARRQAARVLALDPDHRGARALLGFERKGDAWVENPALAEKTPAADLPRATPRTDRRPALRDWRHRALRPAEKRAADVFVALADRLAAAGDPEGARAARRAAVAIVPDHEGARKALGEVRWKDAWFTPDQVRAAESARVVQEGKGSGELGKFVGADLTRVETSRCVFLSRMPAQRLVPWAQACEDVISLLLADLGRNPGDSPVSTKLRIVVCTSEEQWNAWVDGTQTPEDRGFYRKLHGVWGPAWSYAVRPTADATNEDEQIRDHVVHRAAHWALTQGFGVPWMSWLDEGMTHHYVLRSEGRAGTWCANPSRSDYAAVRRDPGDDAWIQPDEWRDLTWKMVAADDAVPLRTMGLSKIHEQPTVAAVEAWSVVSWWRATDPAGFRAFVAKIRGVTDPTPAIEAARGRKIEEVERDWRQWVLVD